MTISLLSSVLAGCGATGPSASPSPTLPPSSPSIPASVVPSTSAAASASPSPVPSPSLSPTSSPPATPAPSIGGSIDSAAAAIAAVGAFDPQFLGYAPQVPGMIGDGPHVIARPVGDDWELTFVTGSGDCMAGCIDHAYAKFSVTRGGMVRLLCKWSTESGVGVTSGQEC